jgi:hypothetical protein
MKGRDLVAVDVRPLRCVAVALVLLAPACGPDAEQQPHGARSDGPGDTARIGGDDGVGDADVIDSGQGDLGGGIDPDVGGGAATDGGATDQGAPDSGGTNVTPKGPSAAATKGKHDGVYFWTAPKTPNGLVPTQSWGGVGEAPGGEVYATGMDHVTNSALYRLKSNDVLYYVGDARAASQKANNWQAGEYAQKFHTRPTELKGRIYVATMNSSTLDSSYLKIRGFHWYGYDANKDVFQDLSAAEPGGVGATHGSLVTLAADRTSNIVYGAMNPTGDLFRYDVAKGKTTKLGRPPYQRPYVYPGRWMWVDSKGRLYFSAGNSVLSYYGAPYDPAIFNHIRYYDPSTGFGEMKGWKLTDQRAIDAGQCSGGTCYMMDNLGHIYRFTESGPTWTHVGKVASLPSGDVESFTWVFAVDFQRLLAYVVIGKGTLFELDLKTGASSVLGNLRQLEPTLKNLSRLYGHGAWDGKGRFFFIAFQDGKSQTNMLLVGIDPVKLKKALGL